MVSEEVVLDNERTKRLLAMGEMAATLAHEMRNPLGSMELFCTLLMKDLDENPELFQLADQIHTGIKTLDRIIANSLQFSKDIKPRIQTVTDIEEFFQEILKYLEPQANKQHVSLRLSLEGSGSVSFDRHLMRQVLLNLILNAIDACTAKSNGEVILKSDLSNKDRWLVSVVDNGCGISPDSLEKVFDPFFTTKNEGTGLGLAIVHSIVSAHRGIVAIESEKSKGTSVSIQLPCMN